LFNLNISRLDEKWLENEEMVEAYETYAVKHIDFDKLHKSLSKIVEEKPNFSKNNWYSGFGSMYFYANLE